MNYFGLLFEVDYGGWMMVVGGVLVVIGSFGLALHRHNDLPPQGRNDQTPMSLKFAHMS